MYDWDLQVAPGPPRADLKRRVLEEWLRNPFLDDDLAALSLRLDAPTGELQEALTGLAGSGFLRLIAGGYALALDLEGGIAVDDPPAATAWPPPVAPAAAADPQVQLASLSGAVMADPIPEEGDTDAADVLGLLSLDGRGDALTREIETTLSALLPGGEITDADLMEALPFGLIVLQPTGALELANERAAVLLGLPRRELDGATFELVTGVNPLAALDRDEPLTFSLIEPRTLEITLQGRRLAAGTAILILLRDVSLLEEVSRIQAEVQEELYDRLMAEMIDPLVAIERFLERPDADGLVQARVAMEQVNWFLQEFFLRGRNAGQS